MNKLTQRSLSRLALGLTSMLIALGMPLTVASSAGATGTTYTNRYYALGDSVAAGYGAGPIASSPFATPCERTTASYPDAIATSTGLTASNLSCTGASAEVGLLGRQTRNNVEVPRQLGQLLLLPQRPTLITLSIGANDVNYTDFLGLCLLPNTPENPGCDTPANTAAFTALLNDARPKINASVALMKLKNPKHFAITGYYDPFGATAPLFGLSPSEVAWYQARTAEVNTMLSQIAADRGVTFVSTASLNAAVGDVILGDPLTTYGFAHPTPAGQNKIAALVQSAVGL